MEDASSPPPRQQQNWRSTASTNWRVKDDTPRVDQQPRARSNRNQNGQQNTNSTQPADEALGTRLYIGNLLYTAQRADVEELFTQNGFNVVGVSMSTDPFTGRNPSYCFVDVESPEEAQRAMSELNGMDVLGRAVRVSPGVARRQGQGQGQSQGNASGAAGGREVRVKDFERGWGRVRESREQKGMQTSNNVLSREHPPTVRLTIHNLMHPPNTDTEYNPTFDRWSRTDANSHWTAPQSEGRRLYLGNMPRIEPQSAHDEEVRALFAQYVPDVTPTAVSKQISPRPPKPEQPGNQYYCFVDLERPEDVDLVIAALDGKEGSWGGNVRVNRAKGSDRKVVKEQGLGGGDRRAFGEGNWRKAEPHSEGQD
ncbi:uncharacterized protein Z520_04728 [Fonsecaea multimorphosa CBS 102226]|uniref:RRM domain-containing protein n=1 Tax=Fonsecaea multimorphosa CBS 102226 TaxID=1442371 RepID=A0A0D2K025_9EURO|nr:uncharacterized protein Z520_04728 [Fonsecaea multimorphosa CBS 102226]KIX99152.1 hypothetical protein Z520_04728 [Fonsecaea multimorphosa CBS 102226]OAL26063.1 hypothetical protein AYO22_04477 [Fonsecaea multimorphosa]